MSYPARVEGLVNIYTCGNIINNNDEKTHFFRKINLSQFILERVAKGLMLVMCERWVGDEQTVTYWPQVPLTIAAFLPHSAGLLNHGPEGPSPLSGVGSHYGILSPTATGTRTVTATRTELCLPQTPTAQAICGTQLYNFLMPTCFLCAYAYRSRW